MRLVGEIDIPGYAATIIVITFFRLPQYVRHRIDRILRLARIREH